MKLQELIQIIREEIRSVLAENAPAPSKPRTTPDREVAEPGTEEDKEKKRRKIGNPNVKPNPKASLEEETIIDKIIKRFKSEKQ
jgi:hypothetical protein